MPALIAASALAASAGLPLGAAHAAEDDQVVPIAASALKAITLLSDGTLKTYPGLSHGMLSVNADVLNADLLAFVTG